MNDLPHMLSFQSHKPGRLGGRNKMTDSIMLVCTKLDLEMQGTFLVEFCVDRGHSNSALSWVHKLNYQI